MANPSGRADAVRNRQKILAAARESFAERGLDVPLDAIAKRAEVGAGTLYRHFPDRDALLAEVLAAELGDLAQTYAGLQRADIGADERLERWWEALLRYMTSYEGLPQPLRAALERRSSPLSLRCEVIIGWTDDLVEAAKAQGVVKGFVTGRDFYRATLGAAWVAAAAGPGGNSSAESMRRINREGWRATGVPEPASPALHKRS